MSEYKITIQRVEVESFEQRTWERLADSGNESDNGALYGYATYDGEREVTTEMLSVTVDSIDLKKVIAAIFP